MRKSFRQHAATLNRLFILICILFTSHALFAQTVSGTVTDGDKKPVVSATVNVKGTARSTSTDNDGKFSINAASSDILVITSVGFVTQEVAISGRSSINVSMATDIRNMEDVLVTALGISKKSRGLGYSATKVNPDELTTNRTPNPINSLEGKVAGVNITSLGTGPGGSSKVRIRGQSGINTSGDPLIVVNGVPINSGNFNSSTVGVTGGGVYSDGGDSWSSINPDDIESMTVLKGAPAAALYGYRAANGVIMITTKSKGKGKGIGVTLNSN